MKERSLRSAEPAPVLDNAAFSAISPFRTWSRRSMDKAGVMPDDEQNRAGWWTKRRFVLPLSRRSGCRRRAAAGAQAALTDRAAKRIVTGELRAAVDCISARLNRCRGRTTSPTRTGRPYGGQLYGNGTLGVVGVLRAPPSIGTLVPATVPTVIPIRTLRELYAMAEAVCVGWLKPAGGTQRAEYAQ